MRQGLLGSPTAAFGCQVLLVAVALSWFLGEPRIDATTTVLILFLAAAAILFLASRSLAQRLAWTVALQALGMQQSPVGGIFVCLPDFMLVLLVVDMFLGRQSRETRLSPTGLAAIGLLLVAAVSTASSPVMSEILGQSLRFFLVLLAFIGLDRMQFSEDELRLTRIAMALVLPVGLFVFYFNGDLSRIAAAVEEGGRPIHSQTLPMIATMMFPWFLLRRGHIVTLIAVAFVYAVTTWIGQARSMILAAAATLLIVFVTRLGRDLSILLTAALIAITGLFAAYSVIETAPLSDAMGFKPVSDEWRLYKAEVSMANFRQYPLLGMGGGSETAMTRRDFGEAMASENGLIESLAELGLLGTVLFLAIALYPARQCYVFAKRGLLGKDLTGALLVMLVVVLAPLTYSSSSKSSLAWLVLAIINKHLQWVKSTVRVEARVESLPGTLPQGS